MAGNSTNSLANDNDNTKSGSRKRKREPFSKADALGVLAAALNECIEAGLIVSILRNTSGEPLIWINEAEVIFDGNKPKIVPKEKILTC